MTPVIDVSHVSKTFPIRRLSQRWLSLGALRASLGLGSVPTFTALEDVSLSVEPGEAVGIIGRNGSGKSTLLKLIAGVTLPTTGTVTVRGRVASLLELGAGFHPMLTGRENVYLNAGLMGMRHAQVDEMMERIVGFSGIGDHIEQPVETYSSGMYVRLAFSVAAHVNPDIFLVDEVLAVGDEEFQRKCRRSIGEFRENGKTIVFVSHDLGIVNSVCQRVLLLDRGRMMVRDTVQKTFEFYLRQIGQEHGIHTLRQDGFEALLCDGRLSLFLRQEEFTARNGMQIVIDYMGMYHNVNDADWKVLERSETACMARGRFSRLPLSLVYHLEMREDQLFWRVELECERAIDLPQISLHCYLSVEYTQWFLGDFSGDFPELLPSDTHWSTVAAHEQGALEAAALPKDPALPSVLFQLDQGDFRLQTGWANSEYISHSRVLILNVMSPEKHCTYTPGLHRLFAISVNPSVRRDSIRSQVQTRRTVHSGPVSARFEHGHVCLMHNNEEITSKLHIYSSMLIAQLWNDSSSYLWDAVVAEGEGIQITGSSRHFPVRQEWLLSPCENGIALEIWLECLETLQVQEAKLLVMLPYGYRHWKTEAESGEFLDIDPESTQWTYLNKSFPTGHTITAQGDNLPAVSLKVSDSPELIPFRMTPVNTSNDYHCRVIQALRTPDNGCLQFVPGRHLYFSGTIRLRYP